MECQVEKNEHFRHLYLYELIRCSEAAEAAQNILTIYGEHYIFKEQPKKWFARFKQGIFT
jgi:hypothetical protein